MRTNRIRNSNVAIEPAKDKEREKERERERSRKKMKIINEAQGEKKSLNGAVNGGGCARAHQPPPARSIFYSKRTQKRINNLKKKRPMSQ